MLPRWIRQLFSNSGSDAAVRESPGYAFDVLEPRILLSTIGVAVHHGVLNINGTNQNDFAEVSHEGAEIVVHVGTEDQQRELRFDQSAVRVIQFRGHDGDDTFINHTALPSRAWGGRGHDTLIGGDGADRLLGGAGNDYLDGGAGANVLVGGLGDNVVVGAMPPGLEPELAGEVKGAPSKVSSVTTNLTNGILVIRGTDLADTIKVDLNSRGGLVVTSRTIDGNLGIEGADLYSAAKVTKIVIDAGGGDDTVEISSAIKTWTRIFGGYGNDTIRGGGGVDNIYGGEGKDRLYGNGGSDFIVGGGGVDTIDGGSGSNTVHQGTFGRTDSWTALESEILRLTNIERTKAGLKPLAKDDRLAMAAQLHSNQMATQSTTIGVAAAHNHNLWGVTLPTMTARIDYAGFAHSGIRENIAYRSGSGNTTAAKVVDAWMKSPGHYKNIMDSTMTHLGVGVAIKSGTYFYTQNFAKAA